MQMPKQWTKIAKQCNFIINFFKGGETVKGSFKVND